MWEMFIGMRAHGIDIGICLVEILDGRSLDSGTKMSGNSRSEKSRKLLFSK